MEVDLELRGGGSEAGDDSFGLLAFLANPPSPRRPPPPPSPPHSDTGSVAPTELAEEHEAETEVELTDSEAGDAGGGGGGGCESCLQIIADIDPQHAEPDDERWTFEGGGRWTFEDTCADCGQWHGDADPETLLLV